jgi:uncharacterized DUF497 family protein
MQRFHTRNPTSACSCRRDSTDENRYLIIGASKEGRMLIVSYTERNGVVRLISAREVTPTERKAYEEG